MKERMRACMKYAYSLVVGIAVCMSLVLALLAPRMISVFMNNENMIFIK